MAIRTASEAEFEQLWQIDQSCFLPGIAYSREELQWYMRRPQAFTVVSEREGQVAGFVLADIAKVRRKAPPAKKLTAPAAESVGHVITIDVVARWRRAGIGSELLASAEKRLKEAGCRTVLLETGVDNDSAIRFYKKHGYSVLRTIPRYYMGQLDAFMMGKKL
ncbi:MAG: GNAT family N-acetyltransferase [Terriglobales bacterium]|jgi:[ribosomal protein S18]-alanine N-acetyltransferase